MARNSNIVEDTMQLRDNIVDLSGQVTRIDGHFALLRPQDKGEGCSRTSVGCVSFSRDYPRVSLSR